MSNNNSIVSSKWHDYHRLWTIVAIILLILLLLLWLLGYGPGGSKCEVPPTIVEKTVEVEKIVDNPKLLSRINELETGNKKIAGLMTTITGLKKDNAQIGTLTAKIKTLEAENADVSKLKATISDLKADNAQIGVLTTKLKALEKENAQLAELKATIKKLKDENARLDYFKAKSGILESENAEISGLMTTVKGLRKSNAKISGLTAMIEALKEKNSKIPTLQKKIEELNNAEPKVIEKIKIIEKIIKVPAAPVEPSAAPVAPKAPQAPDNTASQQQQLKTPNTAKLYFDVGSADFPADVNLSLAGVIAYLKNNPSAKATISGFHDASGSLAANKVLSEKRAESVLRLLVESGVSINSLMIEEPQKTEGEGSPQEARRVEVSIVK